MDEKFVFFFQGRDGVKWYRCKNCGALQRGKPPKQCPVCNDIPIIRSEEVDL
ncbi:MAG: hypothetical protein IJ779_03555 [Ruminococcus sp.]|nr:hypothetical protein [Ruminococcus sp.]